MRTPKKGGGNMLLRNYLVGVLLLLVIAAPASATSWLSKPYTSVWASSDFFPLGTATYRIHNVQNETGHDASFDIQGYLREQVHQQLSENGLREDVSKSTDAIVVDLDIHLYQEGSTFGRWLGGGAGTAYAVVRASFHKSERSLGAELLTISVISEGGLYSSGAEKTVLKDVAEEIVNFLKNGGKK